MTDQPRADLPTKDDVVDVLSGQHRTVAAERDMSRVHHWLDTAVAHAVNDAAKSLNDIRYWCDHTERELQEAWRANGEDYDDVEDEIIRACRKLVSQVRALLPVLPESSSVGVSPAGGGDSDGHEGDLPRR